MQRGPGPAARIPLSMPLFAHPRQPRIAQADKLLSLLAPLHHTENPSRYRQQGNRTSKDLQLWPDGKRIKNKREYNTKTSTLSNHDGDYQLSCARPGRSTNGITHILTHNRRKRAGWWLTCPTNAKDVIHKFFPGYAIHVTKSKEKRYKNALTRSRFVKKCA